MKELIHHLITENMTEIVNNSIIDCHCKGLHSIMLINKPEQRVRLFIAEPGHELYLNITDSKKMSVGYHAHHCNITLHVVKGDIINRVAELKEVDNDMGGKILHPFNYQSPILKNEKRPPFYLPENYCGYIPETRDVIMYQGDTYTMQADQIHTVAVKDRSKHTAWFVYEGKEDESYVPICYHPDMMLDEKTLSHLYKPMTTNKLVELLFILFKSNVI